MLIASNFKQKLHSYGWFILINSLVAMAIAARYFAFLPEIPTDVLGLSFLVSSTFSQMVLLAGLIGLVALPTLFISSNKVRNGLQAFIASLGIAVLFIDTLVFAQYRFHINAVVLELVLSGQVVSFPLITWITVIGGYLGRSKCLSTSDYCKALLTCVLSSNINKYDEKIWLGE
jgi:hypothetical protein